jgi:hypothetical protein
LGDHSIEIGGGSYALHGHNEQHIHAIPSVHSVHHVHAVHHPIRSLTVRSHPAYSALESKMIVHTNSYRYYYYYGPLSTRRGGWAIGCRETD